MADATKKEPTKYPVVTVPGLGAIPVVIVKLPDGTIALRHPSELANTVPAPKPAGGGK